MRRNRAELRQLDGLKRTNYVVRALVLEEALVEARAEIPVVSLVVLVAIKPPDAAHDDETTDPVVPEIAQEMKAQVGAGERALEADVVVNDELR